MIKFSISFITLSLLATACFFTQELDSPTTTFDVPVKVTREVGYKYAGDGRIDTKVDTDGRFTRLKWVGDKDTWAFQLACRNFHLKDFTIEDGGIWIPSNRGFGTGHGRFENVAFIGKGVKFGDASFNGNAADCVFDFCYFRDCDPAIENTTSQNINYTYRNCFFKNCATLFKLNGGGNIWVENCYVVEGERIFHVTGNGTKFGSQQGRLVIDGLTFDAKQKRSPCVLHDEGSWGRNRTLVAKNLFILPGQFTKPKNYELIQIDGKTEWKIDSDSKFVNDAIKEAGESIDGPEFCSLLDFDESEKGSTREAANSARGPPQEDASWLGVQERTQTSVVDRTQFRRQLRIAIRKAVSSGEITRKDANLLRVALFSKSFLKTAEDLCLIQMMTSGEKVDDIVEVGDDGKINRASIQWDKIGDFLVKILPVLLDFLLSLGIGG